MFNDLLGTVLSLELLALVTAVEGDAAEAAVLQGAAEVVWPSVGLPLFGSVFYGRPRAECEKQARAALGNAAYEEGLRAGLGWIRPRPWTGPWERRPGVGVFGARLGRAGRGRAGCGPRGTRRPAASRLTGRGGPERW